MNLNIIIESLFYFALYSNSTIWFKINQTKANHSILLISTTETTTLNKTNKKSGYPIMVDKNKIKKLPCDVKIKIKLFPWICFSHYHSVGAKSLRLPAMPLTDMHTRLPDWLVVFVTNINEINNYSNVLGNLIKWWTFTAQPHAV